MKETAKRWLKRWAKRAVDNPRTTIFGLIQVGGAAWWFWANRGTITPDHLMHPENLVPAGFLVNGISGLFGADAKDELKASEVRQDTTLLGEK